MIDIEKQRKHSQKMIQKHNIKPLKNRSVYRSDQEKSMWDLTDQGFEPLAWTPGVKYLFYNPKKDLLVKDVEGDLFITENPSKNKIIKEIQQFPKAEVSLGEKYDPRFKDS